MSCVVDAHTVSAQWLAAFAQSVSLGDTEAVAATLLPSGWLRDVLTFVWDTRSLQGRQAIVKYLVEAGRLSSARITNITLEKDPYYTPRDSFTSTGQKVGVETGFTYETRHAFCRGYVHLRQTAGGSWLALTLAMIALDLKAHPEPRDVAANWEATGRTWGQLEVERRARIESDPDVLIIGAGQNGVSVAARFRQMDIPALIIDKNARVGDNWRKRYESLALHTPDFYSSFLYQSFPSHWPLYAPKDIVGDWLETYATMQRLTVWTSSTFAEPPQYDATCRRWNVVVDRAGTRVTLHPKHIVLATGTLGAPYVPTVPGRDVYPGRVLHAAEYSVPAPFVGKRVVVIGAGNSAVDICEDLVRAGAAGVTMVQRSHSVVVARESVTRDMARNWLADEPVGVGDFKFAARPLGFLKQLNQSMQDVLWERERELYEKLRKGGVALSLGPDGGGQLITVFERYGGYWLDKGAADLIADGRIQVKHGASPTSFTPDGLRFDDGTELLADVVIFATGYGSIRDVYADIFGKDVVDELCDGWGLDAEGELKGSYRPTGHPALWYATGGFYNCRFMTKQLSMMIKAADLGLYDPAKGRVDGLMPGASATV